MKKIFKTFIWNCKLNYHCWGLAPYSIGMWCKENPKPE